jgi:hypothetical protein
MPCAHAAVPVLRNTILLEFMFAVICLNLGLIFPWSNGCITCAILIEVTVSHHPRRISVNFSLKRFRKCVFARAVRDLHRLRVSAAALAMRLIESELRSSTRSSSRGSRSRCISPRGNLRALICQDAHQTDGATPTQGLRRRL